ncbi:hypothetical protein ACC718_38305, partial [Rhizobium ruizarguesonis]
AWTNNFLVGTATLATQNVAIMNTAYTLSFFGTGSVALSGAFTGSLSGTGVRNARDHRRGDVRCRDRTLLKLRIGDRSRDGDDKRAGRRREG